MHGPAMTLARPDIWSVVDSGLHPKRIFRPTPAKTRAFGLLHCVVIGSRLGAIDSHTSSAMLAASIGSIPVLAFALGVVFI